MTYEEFDMHASFFNASSTNKRNHQTFIAFFTVTDHSNLIKVMYRPNLKDVKKQILVEIVKGTIDCRDETLELFSRMFVGAIDFRDYLKGHL
jgi:hypothetical protein